MLSRARTHQAAQLGLRDNEGVAGREAKREREEKRVREGEFIIRGWCPMSQHLGSGEKRRRKNCGSRRARGKEGANGH